MAKQGEKRTGTLRGTPVQSPTNAGARHSEESGRIQDVARHEAGALHPRLHLHLPKAIQQVLRHNQTGESPPWTFLKTFKCKWIIFLQVHLATKFYMPSDSGISLLELYLKGLLGQMPSVQGVLSCVVYKSK